MRGLIELTGKRFGRWTVLALHPKRRCRQAVWLCRCDCGTQRLVFGHSLRQGDSTCCGCRNARAPLNLIGQRFGRWSVLGLCPERHRCGGATYLCWLCRCACGVERVLVGTSLRQGKTRSCGCLLREEVAKRATRHGHCRGGKTTSIYGRWKSMMQRCFNPNNPQYSNYGGRDITVHERWFDFENYYTDVGDPPPGMSLDRINNDGDYQPWNWQWATQSMQNYNQRRSLKKADKPVIKRGLGRPKGS